MSVFYEALFDELEKIAATLNPVEIAGGAVQSGLAGGTLGAIPGLLALLSKGKLGKVKGATPKEMLQAGALTGATLGSIYGAGMATLTGGKKDKE